MKWAQTMGEATVSEYLLPVDAADDAIKVIGLDDAVGKELITACLQNQLPQKVISEPDKEQVTGNM